MPAAKGKLATWVMRWIVQTLFLVIALGAGTGAATAGTVLVDRVGPSELDHGVLVGATGVPSPHLRWVFGESCGEQAHGPPLAPKGGVGAGTPKGAGSGLTNQTRSELLSSKKSYENLITEHQQKLGDYIANPWAHDNRGLLANAPSDAIRQKIIADRVKVLEGQIAKQQGELTKNLKLLGD